MVCSVEDKDITASEGSVPYFSIGGAKDSLVSISYFHAVICLNSTASTLSSSTSKIRRGSSISKYFPGMINTCFLGVSEFMIS